MTTLNYDRLATELVAQAEGFAALVAGADHRAAVPTCPEWTLGDLVFHLGSAYHRAFTLVTSRERIALPFEEIPVDAPSPPEGDWVREGAAKLASALIEAGPDTVLTSWLFDLPARFWLRRLTCDTVVHRADAAFTVGKPYEVAADLAAEVVSEGLDLLLANMAAERSPAKEALKGTGQTLHFHATDEGLGEWLIQRTPEGINWSHGHAKGDVAVRATAADLMLGLTGRIPIDDRFAVFGDASLLTHWLEHTKF